MRRGKGKEGGSGNEREDGGRNWEGVGECKTPAVHQAPIVIEQDCACRQHRVCSFSRLMRIRYCLFPLMYAYNHPVTALEMPSSSKLFTLYQVGILPASARSADDHHRDDVINADVLCARGFYTYTWCVLVIP